MKNTVMALILLLFPAVCVAGPTIKTYTNVTTTDPSVGVIEVQALNPGAKCSVQVPLDNRSGIWQVSVSADGTNYVTYANYSTGEGGIYNPNDNVAVPVKVKLGYVNGDEAGDKNPSSASITVEE